MEALLHVAHVHAIAARVNGGDEIRERPALRLAQQLLLAKLVHAQRRADAGEKAALERAHSAGDAVHGRLVKRLHRSVRQIAVQCKEPALAVARRKGESHRGAYDQKQLVRRGEVRVARAQSGFVPVELDDLLRALRGIGARIHDAHARPPGPRGRLRRSEPLRGGHRELVVGVVVAAFRVHRVGASVSTRLALLPFRPVTRQKRHAALVRLDHGDRPQVGVHGELPRRVPQLQRHGVETLAQALGGEDAQRVPARRHDALGHVVRAEGRAVLERLVRRRRQREAALQVDPAQPGLGGERQHRRRAAVRRRLEQSGRPGPQKSRARLTDGAGNDVHVRADQHAVRQARVEVYSASLVSRSGRVQHEQRRGRRR
mmetsp:Transcript_9729/g.40851  ORF Transcript_9729/g.40851 Transcript_9729/m.40851 type:complete len:373 (+) Transcript_9729:2523-3641(+)